MLKLRSSELKNVAKINSRFDMYEFVSMNDLDGQEFKLSNEAQRKLFGKVHFHGRILISTTSNNVIKRLYANSQRSVITISEFLEL